jgi:hypothetical protein
MKSPKGFGFPKQFETVFPESFLTRVYGKSFRKNPFKPFRNQKPFRNSRQSRPEEFRAQVQAVFDAYHPGRAAAPIGSSGKKITQVGQWMAPNP